MPEQQTAEITAIDTIGVKYLALTLSPERPLRHQAGQHLIVTFNDNHGAFERPYSIASAARADGSFDLCLLTVGDTRATDILVGRKIGDTLQIGKPRGQFVLDDTGVAVPRVFVAGGSGIAPLRAMLQELTDHWRRPCPTPTTLVYGCDDFLHVPYYKELQSFAGKTNHFDLWVYARHNPTPPCRQGIVTDKLMEIVAVNARYYLCGPPTMLQTARTLLLQKGVKEQFIFSET